MRTTPELDQQRRRAPMRELGRSVNGRLSVGAAALLALLVPTTANAQSDVTPPLPNVLILLDTSGSMERMPNATFPAIPEGALAPKDSTGSVDDAYKNRWTIALEVLGGRIKNLDVLHTKRSTPDFLNEFSLGSAPYDYNYYVPHFRLLTNGCAFAPKSTKTWPADWKTWGPESFSFRKWGGSSLGALGSDCDQTSLETDGLGLLDTYRDQVRFAFMGFDALVDPKTGWANGAHIPAEGMAGTWSYYPGWNGGSTANPFKGWPANCSVDPNNLDPHLHELGARNPSAPPWELPLIPFASEDSTTALRAVNDRIRYAMLAGRPYGATPLAPMMADAQHYLWKDPAGPAIDPSQSCRGNFIILITDGFPNSDLRTSCEDPTSPKSPATQVYSETGCTDYTKGCCPTKRIQDIAYDLAHPTDSTKPIVQTFVVGFAVSDELGNPVDCKSVDPTTTCADPTLDPKFKPCCTLHETAYNGSPGTAGKKAIFADNVVDLRAALQAAMAAATLQTTTSRTTPVFTQSGSVGQNEFQTSFKVNAFGPWTGVLNRVRWACSTTSGTLGAAPVQQSQTEGDVYANNLNKQTTRNFLTVDAVTSKARSGDSLRPLLSTSDSDGLPSTSSVTTVKASGTSFVSSVPAASLEITATSCKDAATADECKQKLLNYALALPQPKTAWMDRFAMGATLGDIYHATPVGVGPPNYFLRDESYVQFRNNLAPRTPMLIVATNDGLLHAFRTDVKSESEASELWAFVPPGVLPHIGKQYGGAHALLLDASPIVKDVPFGVTSGTVWGRTRDNARAGKANWRTIAIGGLTAGRGYYALDITDPVEPKFLWQLTKAKDASGAEKELFGTFPATPAIGTVFYKDPTKNEAIETPVAFLPGGEGTLFKTDGLCPRWRSYQGTTTATTPRSSARCWIGAGNSFTVVRLYDGKILRRFSNDPGGNGTADHPAESNSPVPLFVDSGNSAVVNSGAGELKGYAGIDSPLTGAVSLYPATPGTVTTRAFVGDSDGALWKIDVSDVDPQKWKIDLFHDPYFPGDIDNANPKNWGPVATAPVLSVDAFGDVVVDYGTGDQSNFTTTGINHVYSVTERTKLTAQGLVQEPLVNWHIKLDQGITPTGPMALFDRQLFFSTFTPSAASAGACISGQGTIWGVHYLENNGKQGADGTALPIPVHSTKTAIAPTKSAQLCPAGHPNLEGGAYRCINLGDQTITFGTGITQRPSCVASASSGIGIDPYTGASSGHQTVQDISVGNFEMVAQTGSKAAKDMPTGVTTTGVNTVTIQLTPPLSATRIDAWAAIIE